MESEVVRRSQVKLNWQLMDIFFVCAGIQYVSEYSFLNRTPLTERRLSLARSKKARTEDVLSLSVTVSLRWFKEDPEVVTYFFTTMSSSCKMRWGERAKMQSTRPREREELGNLKEYSISSLYFLSKKSIDDLMQRRMTIISYYMLLCVDATYVYIEFNN